MLIPASSFHDLVDGSMKRPHCGLLSVGREDDLLFDLLMTSHPTKRVGGRDAFLWRQCLAAPRVVTSTGRTPTCTPFFAFADADRLLVALVVELSFFTNFQGKSFRWFSHVALQVKEDCSTHSGSPALSTARCRFPHLISFLFTTISIMFSHISRCSLLSCPCALHLSSWQSHTSRQSTNGKTQPTEGQHRRRWSRADRNH